MAAPLEVHARQLRALLEHLDVACGVAVTSTNGERSMRPRGREVEKSVGRVHASQAYEENSFSGAKDTKMELHRKSGLKIPGEKRTASATLR